MNLERQIMVCLKLISYLVLHASFGYFVVFHLMKNQRLRLKFSILIHTHYTSEFHFESKKGLFFCEIILKILLAMRSVNQHAYEICGIILFWLYFSDCHSFMWLHYLLCFSRNPHYSKLIYSYQREYLKKFDEAGPYIKKIFWTLEKSNYVFRSHWWIYDIIGAKWRKNVCQTPVFLVFFVFDSAFIHCCLDDIGIARFNNLYWFEGSFSY